jgi:hypothetical protein
LRAGVHRLQSGNRRAGLRPSPGGLPIVTDGRSLTFVGRNS